ncbi:SRPBCC family protein [Streptomyces sp. NPDC004609]|uniref:SRPBCC family protein n=1 Tax=Streptomyces sp. NPDC004609 TaxID=3364704 RepID=UPI00367AD54A
MTSPHPTGRLLDTEDGRDLVLSRTISGSMTDVWAHLTESERTARWFGAWKGEAGPGRTIEVRMGFEEGAPWSEVDIEACEPPRRLAVRTADEAGAWHLEALLSEVDGLTTVELIQHLSRENEAGLGEIGPGWEYYLDMFTASYRGAGLPAFETYYPAQKEFYDRLGG